MSQTYATKLNREHSTVTFDHEFIGALRGRNTAVEIEELWSVGSIKHGEEDSGYLLAVVSHLPAPIDTLDVADTERVETLVCGCPGFYFHAYDEQVGAKIDDCSHCERVKEKRRTELPDSQSQLV